MEYSRYRNGKRIYSVGWIEENGAKYYGIFEKHDDKPMWRRAFPHYSAASAEAAQQILDDMADDSGWIWCAAKKRVGKLGHKKEDK